MKEIKSAKRVSSTVRANGLYALELRKRGPRFAVHTDKKKQGSKMACRVKASYSMWGKVMTVQVIYLNGCFEFVYGVKSIEKSNCEFLLHLYDGRTLRFDSRMTLELTMWQ